MANEAGDTSTVTATIPATGVEAPVEEKGFSIPEAYKDKSYLKGVDSEESLYKMLDGAQTLIGSKVTIPTDETSEDDRKVFNKQMGVPEKSEDYVFNKIGDQERDLEVDKIMKGFLHKYNIPAKTATAMQEELEGMASEALKNKTETDVKALDLDFDKIKTETFGEKGDQIIANVQKLFVENIPDNLKEAFNKFSNENLIIVTAAFENFRKKYISEDELTPGGDPVSGTSKTELEGELNSLVAKRKKLDAFSGEFKALSIKITETSKQIAKIG